jgi:hypothetical protein
MTAVQAQKGIPYCYPANCPEERRNIQFGLKLNF